MKININTNHIRICKLLNYTSHKTTDFISEFLKMDKQNVNLYIKQIHSFIDSVESRFTIQNMIVNIRKNKDILNILKKKQQFTKENRIFYIILILLRNRHLNLNSFSSLLGVSRRVLNNDLIFAKKDLAKYGLNINSSNAKGISLSGDENNIKLSALSYLYKLFVEFDELPFVITEDYINFFDNKFHFQLNKDLDIFISEYSFDYFSQNKNLLKAFCIIYGNINGKNEPTIDSLNFNEFEKYFKDIIPNEKMNSCYNFFKLSFIGKILLKNIDIFINILKFCLGLLKHENTILSKELNTVKALVFKKFSMIIKDTDFLRKLVTKISLVQEKNIYLVIHDLEFLRINLSEQDKLKCIQLFFTLRKIYRNLQFSNIIFLYIWSSNEDTLNNVKNTVVVFDTIPKILFPIIRNKFLLKENMNISSFIKPYELDSYLSKYEVDCIITFENLNTKYPFIKSYSLPIE